ncbi:MAG TPA: hypothetical protein VLA72_23500 [Anaerolineales bacterium]|nr:hypothetical protein [Anaerolineales bacterium]
MTDFNSVEKLLAQSIPSPSESYTAHMHSFALSAYDRHYQPEHSKRILFLRKQILGWASVLVFVLSTFMVLTPPGRALAQQILQFGLFIFTNEPTKAEISMTVTPEVYYTLSVVRVNLAEASEIAGFPVYYPTYLPEGYAPISRDPNRQVEVVFNGMENVVKVNAMFERVRSRELLSFVQIPLDSSENLLSLNFGTGQVEPQFVDIGGNEGVWLENFIWGSKFDEHNNQVPVPYNVLIWEIMTQDGQKIQFWLGSEELISLEVMLLIAESVMP